MTEYQREMREQQLEEYRDYMIKEISNAIKYIDILDLEETMEHLNITNEIKEME